MRRIIMKYGVIVGIMLWISLSVSAQRAVITASIDSAQLLIGEQTSIHLEIAADKDARLQLPFIQDTLMQGVEVLAISNPDTADIGNNRMQIKYDYLITSFDSALYLIPPFPLIIENDTVYSNDLSLKISTVPVEVSPEKFYNIKDVMNPSFVLGDYLIWLFYIWGVCALILLVIYLFSRNKEKNPILPFKKSKIILPPHTQALQALDEVKLQKLWQQGKEKEYHSRISEIIRIYLDKRFNMQAMEMTSSQILQNAQGISDLDLVINSLKQILLSADFVKFAKYNPLPEENELSIMNAYLLVNNTKIEALPSETTESNELNKNE